MVIVCFERVWLHMQFLTKGIQSSFDLGSLYATDRTLGLTYDPGYWLVWCTQ